MSEQNPRFNIESVDAVMVRELQVEDIESITDILKQWVRDPQTGEIITTEVSEIIHKMTESLTGQTDDRQYLVAEQGGKTVGVMGIAKPSELMRQYATTEYPLEIINAFVSSESRGSGIGHKLIDEVTLFAEYVGATELIVNSGPRYKDTAWQFYDKQFGERLAIMEDYYGPELDAPVWHKVLPSVS